MTREKVLILSSDYGDGHRQAANAISENIRLHAADVETLVVDFMEWTHPYLNSMGRSFFIQGVKKFPSLYGYLYRKTNITSSFSQMFRSISRFGLGKLIDLLDEFKPTVVVSTFPLAAGAMAELRAGGLTNATTITIITDHSVHSSWVNPFTDHYIVGSGRVRDELIRMTVPVEQITVTGIPVRPEFYQSYHPYYLRRKHGLDSDLPTVLVMGGGLGIIGDGISSIKALDQLDVPMQLIIICGQNEKLRTQLNKELKHAKHHILLLGYVNNVHELMAASDLMITKPGGLSTTEAVALELPMLIYTPLPGQEQANAELLIEEGVAVQADSASELPGKLKIILENDTLLADMKQRAKDLNSKRSVEAWQVVLQTHQRDHLQEVYI